ncbi:MAG TPA: hypothetical protein VF434_01730, partial [Promineifilum sp.]
AVIDVTAESPYILAADPPSITVQFHNSREPLGAGAPEVVVLATWDGGPGLGSPAGETSVALGSSQMAEVEMELNLPPGALVFPHQLTVTVNPAMTIPEADLADNSFTLTLGGVPAPAAITAEFRPGGALVFLSWLPVNDERVAGYRIYRREGTGAWKPVGSAFGAGWVDLYAKSGATYEYAVASYTGFGYESAREATVTVGVPLITLRLPVVTSNK